MEFESIVIVIAGAIIILQQFYINQSLPVDKVKDLVKELRPIVERTPTKLDDQLLNLADTLTVDIPTDESNTSVS